MEDGDLLVAEFADGGGGHLALLVVPRAGAEEVRQPLLGEADGGGAVGHLDNAGLVVDVLGGLGDGGAVGADHRDDALGGQAVGGERGLARVAGVVLADDLDLSAEHAALLVEFVGEQSHHLFHLLALTGPGSGHRSHQSDLDGIGGKGAGRHQKSQPGHKAQQSFHLLLPDCGKTRTTTLLQVSGANW